MDLFKKFKKQEKESKKKSPCCSGGDCNAESMEEAKAATNSGAAIKVLGSGCAKCHELESNVKAALEQLGIETTIDHVTDFTQIAAYGVMSTPALVINSKVVSYGKVLKVEEAVSVLKKNYK